MVNFLVPRCRKPWAIVVCSVGVAACNLDGFILTEASRGDNRQVPEPAAQTLTGTIAQGSGAEVKVLASDGSPVGGVQAVAAASAGFSLVFGGETAIVNAVFQARLGRKHWLALVPEMPAQPSVLAPPRTFALSDVSPGALQADDVTTAMALLVLAKLHSMGKTLAGASSSGLTDTLIDLHKKIANGEPALGQVVAMVARLRSQANGAQGSDADATYSWTTPASLLRPTLLAAQAVDIDGDGVAEATTAKFDAAVAAALDSFTLKACYFPDKIRVVLQTKFVGAGGKDGNCDATFNPYLWTDKAASKVVFVTGGIHKDTAKCQTLSEQKCLTQAQVDQAGAAMGGWVPNVVRMYDDGTHGDGQAGDGVWSVALELPYLEPADGVLPVRIAYKFTYGQPAQGWTNSEEFPGNQRLLELVDVNGDHIVTRFDLFADETTNKDKKNTSQAGCGEVKWTSVEDAKCGHDVRERPVDLDGDCVIDGWPSPGAATPLSIPCPK